MTEPNKGTNVPRMGNIKITDNGLWDYKNQKLVSKSSVRQDELIADLTVVVNGLTDNVGKKILEIAELKKLADTHFESFKTCDKGWSECMEDLDKANKTIKKLEKAVHRSDDTIDKLRRRIDGEKEKEITDISRGTNNEG